MIDSVTIDEIDVTSYRRSWNFTSEWQDAIDDLELSFSPSVADVITITAGMAITVTRGYASATEETVFIGQITQVKPEASCINLVCKNPMYDAIKNAQTKSWDKDTDTAAGVGSEIFKEICDNSSLTYTDDSIPSTGTLANQKIDKFIQNDEDDFDRMNLLANQYDRVITYDYENELVNFKDKGITTYPIALNVGIEIPKTIKWKENMEELVNRVKIQGATVYDKINPAVFAGPATTFDLLKTPEDTEVRASSSSGTLYTRGQKGIGTVGVDYDYYVDIEAKKIVFSEDKSNIWIKYGAQIPLPVIATNRTSVEKYGGPNKIPHFKKLTYNDISSKEDAESRAASFLAKYSTPFLTAKDVPVLDSVIQQYGNIEVGTLLNVKDSFTNKDVTVLVKTVKKSFPHIYDKLEIGDQTWRTEDWQSNQMKKINQIFNALNKNQDILYQTVDLTREISYERRYFQLENTSSAPILKDYFNSGDNYDLIADESIWIGQTFTTTEAYNLTSVNLKLYRRGSPGNVTVSIMATDVDNLPTGSDLISETVNGNDFNTTPDWETITFASSLALSSGVMYAIIIKATAASPLNYVKWRFMLNGTYAGGHEVFTYDSGASWSMNDSRDMLFETYGYTGETNIVKLVQGQKTYKELLYDKDFFDSDRSDSSVSFNIIERTLTIPVGKTYYSLTIEKTTSRTSFIFTAPNITNTDENTITYEITPDNENWQTFTPGVKGYFTTPSTDIRIRITNEAP